MSDDHLVNTIKMLKRKAISERDYSICCAYGAASTLQGEMAQYYTDQEIDYLECHTDWTNYINKIYWDMCKDYERRTGNVWNDFQPYKEYIMDTDYIYPCTIIADRYGGSYSGALFTAWNMDFDMVPMDIDRGDIDCDNFWHNYSGLVGKGSTPQEAYNDLKRRIRERIVN